MPRLMTFTISELGDVRRALDEHANAVGFDRVPMSVLRMGSLLGNAARLAGEAGDVRVVVEVSPASALAPLWTEEGVAA